MPRNPSPPPTLVDRFVTWTKNNRIAATLIVIGIVFGGMAGFADSLRKLFSAATEITNAAAGPTPAELATKTQVRNAARLVDAYFAQAIAQKTLDFRPPTREQYEAMQSAVRQLVVSFTGLKQPERAKIAESGVELLERISPNGFIKPWNWQVEKLESQRTEWANVFRALGHDEPPNAASAGSTQR
jgi:hypothetical protein